MNLSRFDRRPKKRDHSHEHRKLLSKAFVKNWAAIFVLVFGLAVASSAPAEAPVFAAKGAPSANFSHVAEILKRVPKLNHERGSRWPMILWECGPFDPQPTAYYEALLARGLTQHIQLDTNHIAIARALQASGSPVIMMQGGFGPWPSQLAGEPKEWAHQFDEGFKPRERVRPCLLEIRGWQIAADQIRTTLRKFKEAGVTVDAVWMDWESDPMSGGYEVYDQARNCRRCRATLPSSVLAVEASFHAFRRLLCFDLLGVYLAAPVTEIFPKCETTNWMVVHSTPEHPSHHWSDDSLLPPQVPVMFTASNPVAYGTTTFFRSWRKEWTFDREHVDQFWFHLLIRNVSEDQANAARWAPWRRCFPWVSRWCPDDEDPKIPIMTRERYREALRHLWLRGVDGMQIFQPHRKGFEEIVVFETQDAVMIYDEMLAHREFLDGGEPFGFEAPKIQDDGAVWSGLRLGHRALVRTFKQGGGSARVKIEPWPGKAIELDATPQGKTYELRWMAGKSELEALDR